MGYKTDLLIVIIIIMASFNEFTIDKQEYMAVFKFFDRENSGEISID